MYIDVVPNRSSPPAVLLRMSYRQGGRVRKKTVANISHWPRQRVEALRAVLKDQPPWPLGPWAAGSADQPPPSAPLGQLEQTSPFRILRSLPHGHVKAVLGAIEHLGLDRLIASRRSAQRDVVVAMIAARVLFPRSKLDTVVHWRQCTLAQSLGIDQASEDDLYAALDWLLSRKEKIEQKLAARHLDDGSSVLYDLSSSYYTGHHCPLAKFGKDRDGNGRFPVIVYGVLADGKGRPVAVEIYAGNTHDATTVLQQVDKLRSRFGLQRAVLIGDRGSVTTTNIEAFKSFPGLGWIGALRSEGIRQLIDEGKIGASLFDQQNLCEIESDDYPGQRLVACFNPFMAEKRRRTRQELLAATERGLARLAAEVARRRKKPLSAGEIGVKAGRIVNRFKVAKHFDLTIEDGRFSWFRNQEGIEREEQLDGIYVVRTSEPADRLSAPDAVRQYKGLAQVEQAFRCLKTVDLRVRPIYLRTEDHVKAHIFLCVLSYYVEWHMRQALAELLYADDELEQLRPTRDPVAPAEPSASAVHKKRSHHTTAGLSVQPFATLLDHLATQSINTCCLAQALDGPSFEVETDPTPLQARAYHLLGL
jgi:hypothetical protein